MVRVRRLYFFTERIQWTWTGQWPHSVVENLILMTSFFRLSIAGVQLILCCLMAGKWPVGAPNQCGTLFHQCPARWSPATLHCHALARSHRSHIEARLLPR